MFTSLNRFIYVKQADISEGGARNQTVLECYGPVDSRFGLRQAGINSNALKKMKTKSNAQNTKASRWVFLLRYDTFLFDCNLLMCFGYLWHFSNDCVRAGFKYSPSLTTKVRRSPSAIRKLKHGPAGAETAGLRVLFGLGRGWVGTSWNTTKKTCLR